MNFLDYLSASLGFVPVKEKARQVRRPQKRNLADIESTNSRKISIFAPVNFEDIVRFVRGLGGNVPLIVNFCDLDPEIAERSLDFVCGAVCALDGKLQRIGEGIYFFAPRTIKIETNSQRNKRCR